MVQLLGLFLSIFKHSAKECHEVAEYGHRHGPNYKATMCTREADAGTRLPQGPLWVLDRKRVKVGHGKQTYNAAKQLLLHWGHFQLGWAEVDPSTRVVVDEPVVVVAQTLFVWMANPLKIMYVEEERLPRRRGRQQQLPSGPIQRFRFAHGCLEGHSLAGEERFGVEWDQSDDSVWFDIYTISRPAHPVSLLTYPLVRFYQNKFKEESAALVVARLQK